MVALDLSELFPRRAQPVRSLDTATVAALSPEAFLASQFGGGRGDVGAEGNGDGDLCPRRPAPLLLTGGCLAVSRKWAAPGYLAASTQEGLEVDVDVAPPASNGYFPDTKAERAALGIRESTVLFSDLLLDTDDAAAGAAGDSPRSFPFLPSPRHYAYLQQQSWAFDVLFPALAADLRDPALACPALAGLSGRACAKILWLGVSPTRSQLHFDRKDNFICQMCGVKEVLLFGPEQTPRLYQRADADGTSFTDRFSAMDLNADDPGRFREAYPLAAAAEPLRAVLRPGDVLFVPRTWWHVVSSTPDPARCINIMANMFFERNVDTP